MSGAREKLPQLGLWDAEVSKPNHDTITLWAYNNAETIVRKYVDKFPDWFKSAGIDLSSTWTSKLIAEHAAELGQPRPKRTSFVTKRELEAVLRERTEERAGRFQPRILGYADLLIHWEAERLGISETVGSRKKEWWIEAIRMSLLVEVKTVLPTIGELMRQLNLYREACRFIAVVAPDNRYAEILEEQGVLFVHYENSSQSV